MLWIELATCCMPTKPILWLRLTKLSRSTRILRWPTPFVLARLRLRPTKRLTLSCSRAWTRQSGWQRKRTSASASISM
ncbi:hypothetical protein D9M71_797830 [compost metagenome]